jgi:hypothetical protein
MVPGLVKKKREMVRCLIILFLISVEIRAGKNINIGDGVRDLFGSFKVLLRMG